MKPNEIITNRIIELLEKGTIPWRKPWSGGFQTPKNLVNKKPYRGINTFILSACSYESPYWLSFKQAKELGGEVKKGEKGVPVVFWTFIDKDEDGKIKKIPFLRYYTVFNTQQVEGIEDKVPSYKTEIAEKAEIDDLAELLVDAIENKPVIQKGMQHAYYSPAKDEIGVPSIEKFSQTEEYYSTLFHELVHSTGHKDRLARKEIVEHGGFGSDPYAKEELVAEMGAAFLCGHIGFIDKTEKNTAAYIQGWLKKLRNDPQFVISAAGSAQKAYDFLIGRTFETSEA